MLRNLKNNFKNFKKDINKWFNNIKHLCNVMKKMKDKDYIKYLELQVREKKLRHSYTEFRDKHENTENSGLLTMINTRC